MAYLIKAGVGLALFFGGIVLFNAKLQELLEIGTCASGNTPYVIAQPCPEGTGTSMLLLMASIFGGLIGAGIFAFRGDPPWGKRKRSVGFFGLGTLAWGLFFAGTGAALLIGMPYGEVTDPATGDVIARPDSQLGAKIVGITFLVMGLPPLLLGLWNAIKGFGNRDERPAKPSAGAGEAGGIMGRMRAGLEQAQTAQGIGARMPWGSGGSGGAKKSSGDSIGKLERLQKLQESGAITKAEFDKEKAKILAEQ